MNKTRLYYADDPMTLAFLDKSQPETGGLKNAKLWPELHTLTSLVVPLHPRQIIERCKDLIGHNVYTMSEHVVLWMTREVGCGRMKPEDLEVYFVHTKNKQQRLHIDETGEFIDRWPGGFFDERADLLFYDPSETTNETH